MTLNFKQLKQVLAEKLIKDPRINYLENPTKSELIGFLNRTDEKEIKFILRGDKLYVWDAYWDHHTTFGKAVLNIDPYTSATNLGTARYKNGKIAVMINLVQKEDETVDFFTRKYGASYNENKVLIIPTIPDIY